MKEAYSSRPDLKDVPDWELCADKSSFMRDGKHMTGYAVTTTNQITKEKALPSNVSSQRAELITSMKDLKLSKVIWKEKGLATYQGNGIEHTEQTHALLQSIWKCRETAFLHCKAQQNRKTTPELKNHFADEIIKGAAEKGILAVVPQKGIDLSRFTTKCDQKDHQSSGTKAEIKESKWTIIPETTQIWAKELC
ncbi:hypothetical protein HGM15179_019412 [Zosterops borbonicus]|uniref:Uncharacterized protein n=1 Tax=Zosterops borbonicus TaxID=364589 RepID=A0A8K1D871_9PASS|nr:hypothetical protein HGM15179_019412 [Zosterops borbonicus]